MNELNCPAQTHGNIAGCRFCIFIGGGPSPLCIRMVERYRKEKLAPPIAPAEPKPGIAAYAELEAD